MPKQRLNLQSNPQFDDPFQNETICTRPWVYTHSMRHNGGVIEGLKDLMLETSYAQFKDSIPMPKRKELGITQANISDTVMKRVHSSIRRDGKYRNYNDIRSYLRVNGIGIQKAQLIHFACTGEPCPQTILESYKLREELFGQGRVLEDPHSEAPYKRYSQGNTVIPIQTVNDIYERGVYTCTLKELIFEATEELEFIRDENGKVTAVMDKEIYEAENYVRENLTKESIQLNTMGFKSRTDFPYTDEQLGVIDDILKSKSKFIALTGAGGVGKSVTVNAIIGGVDPSHKIMVVCPTGMASKRLKASDIDENRLIMPISTIHSAYFRSSFTKKEIRENPDFIVIDEASMMDSKTMGLLSKMFPHAKWLFIGDPEQLPPVGCGAIFNILVHENLCPVYRLTKVLRTSDPKMLEFFQAIRDKNDWGIDEFIDYFDPSPSVKVLGKKIDTLLVDFADDEDWPHTSVIVSHRNSVVDYINYEFFKKYTAREIPELEDQSINDFNSFPPTPWFWVGAKVVFTENDADLGTVNGDIGFVEKVEDISRSPKFKKYRVFVRVDDELVETDSTYPSIKLAYALTIHKTQGSEYENVYYVHFNRSEIRSLFYTAVTRARESFKILTPHNYCFYHPNPPIRKTLINTLSFVQRNND